MRRTLYRIIALFLALAWGPATMCCALEAAGWGVLCSSEACHDESADEATTDGCDLVEDGRYQSSIPSARIAPPLGSCCAGLICAGFKVQLQHHSIIVMRAEIGRPRDWVPIWRFERRAAALAHAPDSLIA